MGEMSYNQIDHILVIIRRDIQNRAIFPLKFPLKRKVTPLQLWVYNSENRFVGSFYHNTCRVKRVNRFFENWDTLLHRPVLHGSEI